jgi:hypothetical protein
VHGGVGERVAQHLPAGVEERRPVPPYLLCGRGDAGRGGP